MGTGLFEASPFLILLLLGYCLAVIEGDLRCYCNESGCVSTGYMCKSTVGQCFTSLEVRDDVTHQTHGCLDSLPASLRATCRATSDVVISSGPNSPRKIPLLLCCSEHMCNYRGDLDVSAVYTPKRNATFHRDGAAPAEDKAFHSKNHNSSRDDNRDLWFKAAVIAVPIAGGFILILLVLLAVRMLKTDFRHHRRLIVQIRRKQSYSKAHMYITDHFHTEKQHCSLFDENPPKSCPSHRSRDSSIHSSMFSDDSSKKSSSSQKHTCDSVKQSAALADGSKTCDSTSLSKDSVANHPASNGVINYSCDKSSGKYCSSNSDSNKRNNSHNSNNFLFSSKDSVSSSSQSVFGDVNVKVDKSGHPFWPVDSSSCHNGRHQTLALWGKTFSSSPTAVV